MDCNVTLNIATPFMFALKKIQWSDLECNNNLRRCIGIGIVLAN